MPNGAKNWTFTLNNYNDEEIDVLRALGADHQTGGVKYLIFGRETAPDTGTPHLQGYISLQSRKSLSYIKNLVSSRAHFETAKGTPKQNRDYCSKDGEFEEFGTIPKGRGARNDLVAALELVRGGCTRRQLVEQCPQGYARAYRLVERAFSLYGPKRNWKTKVIVYWGDAGTGKSKLAYEEASAAEQPVYSHPGDRWFDGYDGECNVIIDDFTGGMFHLGFLLKLLDRYPLKVPVKGSYVEWLPKTIWITSNIDPREWYPNAKPEHQVALMRRLETIKHFSRAAQSLVNPVLVTGDNA
jgi:hypothetical protein